MQDNREVSFGLRTDGELDEEGVTRLRIAIVQQATNDWQVATKGIKRMYSKWRTCIDCEYRKSKEDYKCFWTLPRSGNRPPLEIQYRNYCDSKEDAERFLKSDWCALISGVEKGYILDRLRKQMPNKKSRSTNL